MRLGVWLIPPSHRCQPCQNDPDLIEQVEGQHHDHHIDRVGRGRDNGRNHSDAQYRIFAVAREVLGRDHVEFCQKEHQEWGLKDDAHPEKNARDKPDIVVKRPPIVDDRAEEALHKVDGGWQHNERCKGYTAGEAHRNTWQQEPEVLFLFGHQPREHEPYHVIHDHRHRQGDAKQQRNAKVDHKGLGGLYRLGNRTTQGSNEQLQQFEDKLQQCLNLIDKARTHALSGRSLEILDRQEVSIRFALHSIKITLAGKQKDPNVLYLVDEYKKNIRNNWHKSLFLCDRSRVFDEWAGVKDTLLQVFHKNFRKHDDAQLQLISPKDNCRASYRPLQTFKQIGAPKNLFNGKLSADETGAFIVENHVFRMDKDAELTLLIDLGKVVCDVARLRLFDASELNEADRYFVIESSLNGQQWNECAQIPYLPGGEWVSIDFDPQTCHYLRLRIQLSWRTSWFNKEHGYNLSEMEIYSLK